MIYDGEESTCFVRCQNQFWVATFSYFDLKFNYYHDVSDYPDASLEDADNYCRNPSNNPTSPWCYTVDSDYRWDFCDVDLCSGESNVLFM